MFSPSFFPYPRSFAHINRSNPSTTWGGKYESQCVSSINCPPCSNILLGDSHWERLARPAHSSLLQDHLPDWINLGIGGDRAEHVAWRALYGSCPDAPANIILWVGTNNLKNTMTQKEITSTANTIINLVGSLLKHYPSASIGVIGMLPQKNLMRDEAGQQINNMLKFRLPASVKFIPPPFNHWNPIYFFDDVHLKHQGYIKLFNSTHFKQFTNSTHT